MEWVTNYWGTCPLTWEKMALEELIPNLALRDDIAEWGRQEREMQVGFPINDVCGITLSPLQCSQVLLLTLDGLIQRMLGLYDVCKNSIAQIGRQPPLLPLPCDTSSSFAVGDGLEEPREGPPCPVGPSQQLRSLVVVPSCG